jgi:poly(A) polymerase
LKNGFYKNHDIEGLKAFQNISEEIALGKKAYRFCSKLIKNHLSISKLFFLKKSGSLTTKDLNFFWYENKDIAPHLIVLTLSDSLATSEDKKFLNEIADFISYLQNYYFDVYLKEVVDEPLLSGKEIMEILNLKPSPKVGEIKEKLLKAQIEGIVKTKEQALNFVKSLIYILVKVKKAGDIIPVI